MRFDTKLITGIVVGIVLGLHYHVTLISYLPALLVVMLILLLKTVRR